MTRLSRPNQSELPEQVQNMKETNNPTEQQCKKFKPSVFFVEQIANCQARKITLFKSL